MRIVHVVPRILTEASGPAYSVTALCKALQDGGDDPCLAVVEPAPNDTLPDFVKLFPSSGGPYKLGRSRELYHWLVQSVRSGDVDLVHNHSLWMMPNVYPGWATRGTGTPLIVSPRGTLSHWALNRSKWAKKLFWHALQKPAIQHAACLHATAASEYEDIRRAGLKQPVCIIPNGIYIPPDSDRFSQVAGQRRLLFLARMHPIKGLDNLLKAWSVIQSRYPDWILDIVGPDNAGYLGQMQRLANELDIDRVEFRGPLYSADKLQAYRDAELYVLPTHSENFGMTVAEALAAGTPAIVTKGAPWGGLETHQAGWWIDIGVEPLVACLEDALSRTPEVLAAKGSVGRNWMQAEFSWERVGSMMSETYRWLCNGGQTPHWVRT